MDRRTTRPVALVVAGSYVSARFVGQEDRLNAAELVEVLRRRPAWMAEAACREKPGVDFFFPPLTLVAPESGRGVGPQRHL